MKPWTAVMFCLCGKRTLGLILLAGFFLCCGPGCRDQEPSAKSAPAAGSGKPDAVHPVYRQSRPLMGALATIQVAGLPREAAERAVERAWKEMARLETLAHPQDKASAVRLISEAAGKYPVAVPAEILEVLGLARCVSASSHGAFDVTFAGAGRLWDFRHADSPLPGKEQLAQAVGRVGWRRLILDEKRRTAFLQNPGMEVGLGAIAKGYAADRAMRLLKGKDATGALIDAGGDMLLAGTKNGDPWAVGIQHPRKPRGELYARLRVSGDLAVVTSGDYERGFVREGVRYHHILDPRTGEPARLCRSVTVAGPSCALADALATAVFVMGPAPGLAMLAAEYPGYDAFILDTEGREHASPGFAAATGLRRTE